MPIVSCRLRTPFSAYWFELVRLPLGYERRLQHPSRAQSVFWAGRVALAVLWTLRTRTALGPHLFASAGTSSSLVACKLLHPPSTGSHKPLHVTAQTRTNW